MTLKQFIDALTNGKTLYRQDSWHEEFILLDKHNRWFYIKGGDNFMRVEKDILRILHEISSECRHYKAIEHTEAAEIMKNWFIEITKREEHE